MNYEITPPNLFSFPFTIDGLEIAADLRGNAPYSCVTIAKGFHSRSILYSGQFNTQTPIKCYCLKNALYIWQGILKCVFIQHACCSFKKIEWIIAPGNMTETWMTSIDLKLTKDLNRWHIDSAIQNDAVIEP